MDGTQKFEDQYELATWLKTYVQRQSVDPKHFGPRMEYLKMLIEVLQIYQLDTPQQLEACFTGAPHSVGEDSSQFKAAIDNILHSIAPNSDGTKIIDETDLTIWTLLHICKTTMTAESGNRLEVARQKGFVMIQSINIALSLGQYTKKSFTSHSAAALQLIQQLLVPNGDPSIEGQAVRLVNTIWDVYMSELIFSHEEPPDWSSDEYQSYILWVLSCSLAWNGIVAVPESITKTPDQVFLWPGHLGWPSRKVEVSVGPVSPHIKLPPMVQAPFGRILPHTNTGHHASLPEKNSSSTLDSVSLYIFMYISAGTWKKFNLDSLKDVSSWKYSQVSMDKVARGQWIEETEDTQEIRTQELDGWEQGRWCYRDSIIRGRLPVYQPGTNSDYLSKQEQCLSATKNHPEEVLFYQNGLVQNGMQRQVDYKNGEKEYEHRKENDEVMRQKEDRKREEEDKKRQKEDKKRQESEESEERIDGLGRKRGRLVKEGPLYTHEKQEKPFEAVKKQDDYVTTGKGRHRRKGKRAKHRATEEVFD